MGRAHGPGSSCRLNWQRVGAPWGGIRDGLTETTTYDAGDSPVVVRLPPPRAISPELSVDIHGIHGRLAPLTRSSTIREPLARRRRRWLSGAAYYPCAAGVLLGIHGVLGVSTLWAYRQHACPRAPVQLFLLKTLFIRSALGRMVLRHSRSAQRRPRMKLHRNARTTPAARAVLVQRDL